MRFAAVPLLSLVMMMVPFSGSASFEDADAGSDWASLALPPETFADIVPVAPGPYTGPGDDAEIPEGWKKWGGGNDHMPQCGDLDLVFLNTDLQGDESGIVQAQGRFFIQFQAVGEDADEITRFSFSFGKTTEDLHTNEDLNCNDSLPDSALGKGTGGAYLLFYRSDFNKDDGFFVPIETMNVPDGDYAAAVHAYTGDGLTGYTEVARAWAMATVKNCDGTSIPNSCPEGGVEEQTRNDKTQPWPMVLPGDGEQTNDDVDGLTIEVLEDIGQRGGDAVGRGDAAIDKGKIRAWLNGEELRLEGWEPPARDRDLVPLNDEDGCPAGQNVRSVCEKVIYSTGVKWEGEVKCDDIIKVSVEDLNKNTVSKQIHNCKTFGGATTAEHAIVEYEVISDDALRLPAGDEGVFNMGLRNVGGADAHVNLLLEYNETHFEAFWRNIEDEHEHPEGGEDEHENHVMIKPADKTTLDIVVRPKVTAPQGDYPIRAGLEYLSAGKNEEAWRDLSVTVDSPIVADNTTDNETDDPPEVEDSPFPGAVAVALLAFGLVALVRRRRD